VFYYLSSLFSVLVLSEHDVSDYEPVRRASRSSDDEVVEKDAGNIDNGGGDFKAASTDLNA